MQCISVLALFSTLCLGAPPELTGTNGAGEVRTWTAFDGQKSDSINAAFIAVHGGVVALGRTVDYKVSIPVSPYKPNHRRHETVKRTVPIQVPLAMLSASDRRWIEERNPVETCLTKKSKKGEVGTLTPKHGYFFITQVDADENRAIVQYVRSGDIVWTFCLQSKLVSQLKPLTKYESISCHLIPNYHGLPRPVRERYGIDFKITEKCSKKRKAAETIDIVEDNR